MFWHRGLATTDVALAYLILRKAEGAGLGTVVETGYGGNGGGGGDRSAIRPDPETIEDIAFEHQPLDCIPACWKSFGAPTRRWWPRWSAGSAFMA